MGLQRQCVKFWKVQTIEVADLEGARRLRPSPFGRRTDAVSSMLLPLLEQRPLSLRSKQGQAQVKDTSRVQVQRSPGHNR